MQDIQATKQDATTGPYIVHENDQLNWREFGRYTVRSANVSTCFAPIADLYLALCDLDETSFYELDDEECRANAYLLAASWDMRQALQALQILTELSDRNTYAEYRAAVQEIVSAALAKTMPPNKETNDDIR